MTRKSLSRLLGGLGAGLFLTASPGLVGPSQVQAPAQPAAAPTQKPNIMFIMGDDIGFMQPHIYHRGLMVGETPNIDRIGNEGSIFMDYVAMQSCTSLPPAASHVRTRPHGFGNLPPASHAPAPPVAVLARARQLPCATRPPGAG
jgi:hypothetical protein